MPRFKGPTMTVHLKQTLDVHSNLLLTDFVVQQQDLQEFLINYSQKIKTQRKKIRLLSPTKNTSTWRWEKFFYLLTKSPLFLCIRWAWWCWERGWFRDTWLILIIMMSFFLSRERVRLKNECDQQDCQVSAKAVSLCLIQMRRKKRLEGGSLLIDSKEYSKLFPISIITIIIFIWRNDDSKEICPW